LDNFKPKLLSHRESKDAIAFPHFNKQINNSNSDRNELQSDSSTFISKKNKKEFEDLNSIINDDKFSFKSLKKNEILN
jgi:hypothetical protein